ncbi:MAG TPA: hypothetical protein VIL55_01395 [Naasia sp.]
MIDQPELDDEARAWQLASWRCLQALIDLPAIMAHVRSLIVETDGRVEAGEEWRQLSSPLRLTPTDDADRVYAEIVNWVGYWAEVLDLRAPLAVAWSNDQEVQGFRAGTTAERAAFLTGEQTNWLRLHHDEILAQHYAPRYVEDVTDSIWTLRSRYPTRPPRPRPRTGQLCELCYEYEMRFSWFHGEDRDRAVLQCSHCWHQPVGREASRVREDAEIARWLEQQQLLNPKSARIPESPDEGAA